MFEVFDQPDLRQLLRPPQPLHHRAAGADADEQRFVIMEAKQFAERLRKEAGSDAEAQVDRAFQLALSRGRRRTERTVASDSSAAARTPGRFCQAMFNLNEFVYRQ